MRPVTKLNVGDLAMLPNNMACYLPKSFSDYREAKPYLVWNLDCCCSYCENAYNMERDLQVEHVQPKGLPQYAHLETEWCNFLLSCPTCNGADNKDTKNVVLDEVHLPHRNNTFLSLEYKAGGVVNVNPALIGDSYRHAENLIHLVGLDKTPKTSCAGDLRWRKRSDDWKKAERYLEKYRTKKADVETIIDLVKTRGGWSIWFTVFEGEDEVRKALITEFRGTSAECFDAANHYKPIPRNVGQADPV